MKKRSNTRTWMNLGHFGCEVQQAGEALAIAADDLHHDRPVVLHAVAWRMQFIALST